MRKKISNDCTGEGRINDNLPDDCHLYEIINYVFENVNLFNLISSLPKLITLSKLISSIAMHE